METLLLLTDLLLAPLQVGALGDSCVWTFRPNGLGTVQAEIQKCSEKILEKSMFWHCVHFLVLRSYFL